MGYILYEIDVGGYYGGNNKKYKDMFDMSPTKYNAEIFDTEAEAQEVRSALKKGGYNFVVEERLV